MGLEYEPASELLPKPSTPNLNAQPSPPNLEPHTLNPEC